MFAIIKKHKTLLSVLLSLVFLYLALRKISWEEMKSVFSSMSFSLLVQVVLINIAARYVVVYRWWLLLSKEKNPGFGNAFHYMNIGYFINGIMPARTGDFVKSVLLARKINMGKTAALTSVALERLFDMAGLGMAFIVSLIVLHLPLYLKQGGFVISFFAVAGMIALAILSRHGSALSNRLSGLSGRKTYAWLLRKLELLLSYSSVLRNRRVFFGALTATAVSWFLYVYAGFIIVERIAPGPYSWHVSLLSLLLISISFVLPTTPGNLGVYQFACVLAFSIADMPKEPAVVFSLISQLPVYLLNILLGLSSMWHEGISKQGLRAGTA
jgi:uncharacterized protein (TIRG00374 family)